MKLVCLELVVPADDAVCPVAVFCSLPRRIRDVTESGGDLDVLGSRDSWPSCGDSAVL